MITFITGMPGDGKTLFAVTQILKILIETERFVVTNIKLNRARIHEYVTAEREKRKEPRGFVLDDRLMMIEDGQAFEFYRFRAGMVLINGSPDMDIEEGGKRLPKKEHDAIMLANFKVLKRIKRARVGVDYFIDEVHEIFPSREWDKGGRGVLYYASKHRHLHDEIYLITQQIDQVEKQLRNLASETIMVRNYIRRNVGWIKMRPKFVCRFFYGIPTPQAKPFQTTDMFLDIEGAASCYKTTGALGVHEAPEKIKNKGFLPWWTLVVGGVAIVLLVIAAFTGLPYLGGHLAAGMVGGVQKKVSAAFASPGHVVDTPKVGATAAISSRETVKAIGSPAVNKELEKLERPFPTGVVRLGERVIVQMSDGETLDNFSPRFGGTFAGGVFIDGQRVRLRGNPAPAKEPVEARTRSGSTSVFGGGGAQPPEGASEMGGRRVTEVTSAAMSAIAPDVVPASVSPHPFQISPGAFSPSVEFPASGSR
jgi:hypothetical protein